MMDELSVEQEWIEVADRFEDDNPWLPLDELMVAFERGDR
jgi:hypothetical protein